MSLKIDCTLKIRSGRHRRLKAGVDISLKTSQGTSQRCHRMLKLLLAEWPDRTQKVQVIIKEPLYLASMKSPGRSTRVLLWRLLNLSTLQTSNIWILLVRDDPNTVVVVWPKKPFRL